MKNDINIIKNEIIEALDEKKAKEKERQEKKDFQEFKSLCQALIFTSVNDSIKKGVSLEEIYLQKDDIIDTILQDIKSQTILVENKNSFKDEKIEVLRYTYPDYIIINILYVAFDKEYAKIKKRIKEEENILSSQLYQELKSELVKYIQDLDYPVINFLNVFDSEEYHQKISNNYTGKKYELMYNNIYFKVIKDLKRTYKQQIEEEKTSYQKKPNIFLRYNIFRKALITYWKM